MLFYSFTNVIIFSMQQDIGHLYYVGCTKYSSSKRLGFNFFFMLLQFLPRHQSTLFFFIYTLVVTLRVNPVGGVTKGDCKIRINGNFSHWNYSTYLYNSN